MKTFTVAIPLCAPSRQAIATGVRKQISTDRFPGSSVSVDVYKEDNHPLFWRATIRIRDAQADWAQYVAARAGWHVERWFNEKNEATARRRLAMRRPPEKGSWHEVTCKHKPPASTAVASELVGPDPVRWWSPRPKTSLLSHLKGFWK
jgi:hypothetical protein